MDTSDEYIVEGETGKNLDDHLSPFIQNVIRSHDLPGLAVGIVADNEVVYARGFGVKSIETQEPISMTTVFHMASISKPFVATAMMQLVEQNQIQLDAPVVAYIPYFKLDDDRYRDITVQQMLSHVSGMPDVMDYEWDTPQYDEGALERYVRSLSSKKLIYEPGEKYAYSNMAFEWYLPNKSGKTRTHSTTRLTDVVRLAVQSGQPARAPCSRRTHGRKYTHRNSPRASWS